jgi:cytoskeletal protein CcmA (bactofilin family)
LDTTDIDGSLNVQDMATFQANVQINDSLNVTNDAHIGGNFQVDLNSDLDGDLDVDGVSNLDTTDIDGSLNVQDMATFQKNVQINDSLNVTNDAHIGGNFQVDLNSDLDGTLDVDGDTELDTTNIDGSLTVRDFADLNDSLDVEMSVNIQDNLDVNDSLSLNTANNEGRVFTMYDSQGGLGVTIETTNTSGSTSATTLTTHRLVVQDDAVYNGDMNVNGALAVTSNITSAAAPTSPNHITNKQYVDDAIADALTPPQMWDYEAINSTSSDTIYYINGDLLLYAAEEDDLINYTIKLYGADLNQEDTDMEIVQARLRSRGNGQPLFGAGYDFSVNNGGGTATFNIGYTDIRNLAGGQEDGYVSCSLQFEVAGGQKYNSGLTIRFYLDSENTPPTAADFQTPEPAE